MEPAMEQAVIDINDFRKRLVELGNKISHKKRTKKVTHDKIIKRTIHNYHGFYNNLQFEVNHIKNLEQVLLRLLESATSQKGGIDLDPQDINEIKQKIHELSVKIAVIEERTKALDKIKDKVDQIPSKDEIKGILSDVITNQKLANQDFVHQEVRGAILKLVFWMIGIGIAIAGVVVKFFI